jgi:hypothetical protein
MKAIKYCRSAVRLREKPPSPALCEKQVITDRVADRAAPVGTAPFSTAPIVDREAPLARTWITGHVAGMALPKDHDG